MKSRVRLLSALALALVAASAAEPDSCRRAPGEESEHARLEAEIVKRVNEYREDKGLPELRADQRLMDQARRHSASMATGDVSFGHDRFRERVQAARVRFTAAAENVGQNQGFSEPAAQAVADWLDSDGHRANILGDYNLTGVGVARSGSGVYFFTQIFILESDSGQ